MESNNATLMRDDEASVATSTQTQNYDETNIVACDTVANLIVQVHCSRFSVAFKIGT